MDARAGRLAGDAGGGPVRERDASPPTPEELGRPAPAATSPGPDAGPGVDLGPFPRGDGWGTVYRLGQAAVRRCPSLGRMARAYFWPAPLEKGGHGRLYRVLGVPLFGRLVPTGGVTIRRLTGARMAPYTLAGPSLGAARAFFYRTCIFEALHLFPMLLLVGLSAQRLADGRPDLALENGVVNLLVNVYPILHHRHTRLRILRLLERDGRRRGLQGQPPVRHEPGPGQG